MTCNVHLRPELNIPFVAELNPDDLTGAMPILEEKGAHSSIECCEWADRFPYRPLTVFNIAHNGKYLFIDFFVRCNFLRAVNSENNSPVSDDSCVEVFISPTSNDLYYNFEFNCIGTVLASHRKPRGCGYKRKFDDEEIARIKRYASCGNKPFNEVEGLFAWNVVVAIPLDLIGVEYKGEPIEMTANFNKVASATQTEHYLTWSWIDNPIPDFHRPDCFGKITLM